jgi:hypothetical protein
VRLGNRKLAIFENWMRLVAAYLARRTRTMQTREVVLGTCARNIMMKLGSMTIYLYFGYLWPSKQPFRRILSC